MSSSLRVVVPVVAMVTVALSALASAQQQGLSFEQAAGGEVTVSNRHYSVVHDPAKGGSITRITFADPAAKSVDIEMHDGMMQGGEAFRLTSDADAQVRVERSDDGKRLVVHVDARYRSTRGERERAPAVNYRYTYTVDSPLIRVEAELPRQRPEQNFTQLQQFVFNFPGEKAFDKLTQLITTPQGTIVPLSFPLTPCETRPFAGLLRTDDAHAFALVSPVTGSFRLDMEAMHIRSGVFLSQWFGRRLLSGATIYAGPADNAPEALSGLKPASSPRDPAKAPEWRAIFKPATGGAMVLADSTDRDPEISDDAANGRRVHTWRNLPAGDSAVNVTVTQTPSPTPGFVHWSIDVQPVDKSLGLWEVEFPVVGGLAPDPALKGSDFLVFPYKSGARIPNPAASGLWNADYPGSAGWQFLAYWQGDRGLYIGAHDPGAATKQIQSLPTGDGTLELSIAHPVSGQGLPGTGWTMDYPIVIGTYKGDWFEAAQLYRDWLVKQSWFPRQPLHANDDVPRWMRDTVVATRRSGVPEHALHTYIEEHPGRSFKEYHTGVLDEFEQLGEPPTLFWWYHAWFKPGDSFAGTPDFEPPPGFRQGVELAQSKGIHTIAYTLGSWWDYEVPSWKDENAESAAIVSPDGKPYLYTSRHVGIMCHATALYQEKMQRVIANLLGQAPVDGTYFDLGGTSGAMHCYATEHGHPVGSGSWMTDGKRQLMRQMRAAGRKVNPEFVLVMEGNADCYLDAVDGYAMFEDNIPMRQALTADYLRSAGDKRAHYEAGPLEAVNVAKHFAWGVPIGRLIGNELQVQGKYVDERVAHYRRLVRHKQVARPWLNYGKMLRPPAVRGVDPAGPAELMPETLVPHATWQAPDGSIAFVFANGRHSTPVKFRWSADPSALGIPTGGTWSLHQLEPDDAKTPAATWTRLDAITGPLGRDESLPNGGTLILVARPGS